MVKGVIFDLDGVLLDSMIIWVDLATGFLRSKGIEYEKDLRHTVFSMTIDQGVRYLKENYPVKETPEEIIKEVQGVLVKFYHDEVQAKPGALDLLSHIRGKGLPIVAATSSPRLLVEKALERNGITPFLSELFITDEIGADKHTPVVYQKAAEFMGLAPEEVLVFEDSLFALSSAKKAGFQTVGIYDPDGEIDQEGLKAAADHYILSLSEAMDLIQ